MSHSTFLCGRAIRALRDYDATAADRILADVSPADLPGVLRGMEDVGLRHVGERAGDMALLIAGVRS